METVMLQESNAASYLAAWKVNSNEADDEEWQ